MWDGHRLWAIHKYGLGSTACTLSSIRTRALVLTKAPNKDQWQIRWPEEGYKRWGGVTTIRLMNFIYHLGHGKDVAEADRLAFEVVRRRRKKQTSRSGKP